TRRNQTCQQCDQYQQHDNSDNGGRVGWFDLEEQGRKNASEEKTAGQPNDNSRDREGHAAQRDQAEHITALSAQSDSNTDLTATLRDDVGQQSIQTNNGENQRQAGKDRDQQKADSL